MKKEIELNIHIVDYKLIKDMCNRWYEIESKLNEDDSKNPDNLTTKLWFNIIDANIFDLASLDRVFGVSNKDCRILTRLSQLYLNACVVIGVTHMQDMHTQIDKTLKEFGITNYNEYRKKYPFIVLIPILNDIQRRITSNM